MPTRDEPAEGGQDTVACSPPCPGPRRAGEPATPATSTTDPHHRDQRISRRGGADRNWGPATLLLGLMSVLWSVATFLPPLAWIPHALPAWPAATLGLLALVLARFPGAALPRGIGAFLGLLGLLVGIGKIALLYGLLEVLGRVGA